MLRNVYRNEAPSCMHVSERFGEKCKNCENDPRSWKPSTTQKFGTVARSGKQLRTIRSTELWIRSIHHDSEALPSRLRQGSDLPPNSFI